MLRRDSSIGRSASMLHKVVGVVTFALATAVFALQWFGRG